ncbi:MAG: hypothetical protein QXU54_00900 [Candidatus Micrarchaeia archaeon]
MLMGSDQEGTADFRPLIALILLVIIALAILWMLQGVGGSGCPPEAVQCPAGYSSECGCCVQDKEGNYVEYCDYLKCGAGYYLDKGKGICCKIDNPAECTQNVCVNPDTCSESSPCCNGFSCNAESKCEPCEKGMLCNPNDVNSCCDGYACNSKGRCEPLTCESLPCEKAGEPCEVCDASGNCVGCLIPSTCVYDTALKKHTCKQSCGLPGSYVCEQCPNGCCLSDGSCMVCTDKPCTKAQWQAGEYCKITSDKGGSYPCIDTLCVPTDTSLSAFVCKEVCNKCPAGFVCDESCEGTGCKDPKTGACASCVDKECTAEQAGQLCTISDGTVEINCPDAVCTPTSPEKTAYSCKQMCNTCPAGYVCDDSCASPQCKADPSKCGPLEKCMEIGSGTCGGTGSDNLADSNGDDTCIEIVCDEIIMLQQPCTLGELLYSCTSDGYNWNIFVPQEYNEYLQSGLDLQIFEQGPPEICLDCMKQCNPNGATYDLNGDTYIDGYDLQLFDQFLALKQFDKRYDFNDDNKVDEEDRKCMEDVCTDGSCRVVSIAPPAECINSETELSAEEKVLLEKYLKGNVTRPAYDSFIAGLSSSEGWKLGYKYLANIMRTLAGTNTPLVVYRGQPLIYGSKSAIESTYYSGCSYLGEGDKRVKLFEMRAEEGCTGKVIVSESTNVENMLVFSQKAMFNECFYNSCIAIATDTRNNCTGAVTIACWLNPISLGYPNADSCYAALSSKCDLIGGNISTKCLSLDVGSVCTGTSYNCRSGGKSVVCNELSSKVFVVEDPFWMQIKPMFDSNCDKRHTACENNAKTFKNVALRQLAGDSVYLMGEGYVKGSSEETIFAISSPIELDPGCPYNEPPAAAAPPKQISPQCLIQQCNVYLEIGRKSGIISEGTEYNRISGWCPSAGGAYSGSSASECSAALYDSCSDIVCVWGPIGWNEIEHCNNACKYVAGMACNDCG